MTKLIQSIRGMNDILPSESNAWQQVEAYWLQLARAYGYQEIRLPILEQTSLFQRSIGSATDIVEKEMYTFTDRNGDSLSLRPEGTASCVRSCLQHSLLHHQPQQRLWYMGPMFRHERPQQGRYRQFQQIGVEAFGFAGPDIEAELILLSARFWKVLDVSDQLTLQINSLGNTAVRQRHREKLMTYFKQHHELLDEAEEQRLQSNPLRLLDSKNPKLQDCISNAPSLIDELDEECEHYFTTLCDHLTAAGIDYQINPRLVRGLDYYAHTVFEWVSDNLGAQGTVCAGGRYDNLLEQLGGNAAPATGFAIGVERLLSLYQQHTEVSPTVSLHIIGEQARTKGLLLAEQLHDALPELCIITHCSGGSLKSQLKKADKSAATLAMIYGDDEIANNTVTIKYLREKREQDSLSQEQLIEFLHTVIR